VVKFTDQAAYVQDLQRVFAHAQLVLARSGSLLERLKELGCPEEKLRLNRTPIPLEDRPSFVRQPPVDGHWHLVQACRLIRKKGLFTLLTALVEVIKIYPALTFHLCGTGPDEVALRTEAERLGISDHVVFHGWQSQDQLQARLAQAHIFLHPSELTSSGDQEGVPNSMLEAMATGLPIVATQHGGIPEAVTHEVDSLLVPEKDPAALAAALIRLLADPVLLAALSQGAAESVRSKYGATHSIAAMEDCYEEAIRRAVAGPRALPERPH
jgi:colanic acid/amylovoran biosynthesis glycosyltransferase